ncbi:MAG: helix-turn-helix transcriptional regulator [Acidobacteriota bacterium]
MAKFAEALGMKPPSLAPYLKGDRTPGHVMQKKLRELGADIEYIMTGQRSQVWESNVKPAKGHFYKVIRSINAGDPVFIFSEVNYTGEDIFFPYEKKDRCFSMVVSGDSMTGNNGKSIYDGDYVLVDMDAQIINGDIVVISLANGRDLIKQYVTAEGEDRVTFRSFNPRNPDIIVHPAEIQTMFRVCMHLPKPRKL